MKAYKIKAIPFGHEMMDEWRRNFGGLQYHHEPTNFIITGAVDDLWINPKGELIVVDYKATSKQEKVTLDAEWQMGYKDRWKYINGFSASLILKYLILVTLFIVMGKRTARHLTEN